MICGTQLNNAGTRVILDFVETDFSTCTYVVFDQQEYQDIPVEQTSWTLQEANELIAITVLLWGIAWIFKMALNQLLNRR